MRKRPGQKRSLGNEERFAETALFADPTGFFLAFVPKVEMVAYGLFGRVGNSTWRKTIFGFSGFR